MGSTDIPAGVDMSMMLRMWQLWDTHGKITWIIMKCIMSVFAADAGQREKRQNTAFFGRKMVLSAGRNAEAVVIPKTDIIFLFCII